MQGCGCGRTWKWFQLDQPLGGLRVWAAGASASASSTVGTMGQGAYPGYNQEPASPARGSYITARRPGLQGR
jgi:hypothetical protein